MPTAPGLCRAQCAVVTAVQPEGHQYPHQLQENWGIPVSGLQLLILPVFPQHLKKSTLLWNSNMLSSQQLKISFFPTEHDTVLRMGVSYLPILLTYKNKNLLIKNVLFSNIAERWEDFHSFVLIQNVYLF